MTKWTEHREGPVSDLCGWPDARVGDQSVSSLEGINSPVFTYVLGEGHEGH